MNCSDLSWIAKCHLQETHCLFLREYTNNIDCGEINGFFSLFFGMNILKKVDHYSVFRVSRMLSSDQWLQNALNISDNSSIYNCYGTNRVIIV